MSIDISERENGIHVVQINRPEKKNAMTFQMYIDFGLHLAKLDEDDDVRCVIIQGGGQDFCAGSDISSFDNDRSGIEQAKYYADLTYSCLIRLRNLRHPTLALIKGACVGGGLEIAAMCDIRIATDSARFGIPINRLGLTLDHNEIRDILRTIGSVQLTEMLLTGNIYNAEKALSLGLVNEIHPMNDIDQYVDTLSKKIAQGAPLVNRWHKKFIRQIVDGVELTDSDLNEAYESFNTEDYKIGKSSFAEKKKPVFIGK